MRATTQRGALLETLGKVKAAVAARHTIPVVTAVLICGRKGQLTLTGTNLEVTLSASCKANISRGGAIAIVPKILETFLKAVTAETVTLSTTDEAHLKVEAGAVTILEGFDGKEYPEVPNVRGKPIVISNLADGLKQVSYAMADSEARPILNGVCFSADSNSGLLIAADEFRLAETKVKTTGSLEQTVVPARAVQLIEKLMPGKVSVSRWAKKNIPHISFFNDGLVLTAMVVQGQYPDYKKVIPSGGKPLVVESKALKSAFEVVSITLPDNNIVRLLANRGKLTVSTKNDEKGETEIRVPAKGKAQIAFNFGMLKELLALSGDKFTMRLDGPKTPGVVKQNGTIHVLMPMFVEW